MKAPRSIPHRMAALLLALLLAALTVMPSITSHADGETSESDSDRDSGGHQVGDRVGGGHRVSDNEAIYRAYIHCKFKNIALGNVEEEVTLSVYLKGDGYFNIRPVRHKNSFNDRVEYLVFVFSDEPFTLNASLLKIDNNVSKEDNDYLNVDCTDKRPFGNSSYYYVQCSIGCYYSPEFISLSIPNLMSFIEGQDLLSADVYEMIESTLNISADDLGSDPDRPDPGSPDPDNPDPDKPDPDKPDPDNPDPDKPDFNIDFSNIFTLIYTLIKALLDAISFILSLLMEALTFVINEIGQFSALCGSVFSFLPDSIFSMITVGFAAIILIGILHK